MEGVIRLARALQPLACRIIERGFSIHDLDVAELQETGHIFSAHFRVQTTEQRQSTQESNSGLETLAAAATVLQSHGTYTSSQPERRDSAMVQSVQQAEYSQSQSVETLSNMMTGPVTHPESRPSYSFASEDPQLEPDFPHLHGYDSNNHATMAAIGSTLPLQGLGEDI